MVRIGKCGSPRGEFPLGQFLGSETEEKGGAGMQVSMFQDFNIHGAEPLPEAPRTGGARHSPVLATRWNRRVQTAEERNRHETYAAGTQGAMDRGDSGR